VDDEGWLATDHDELIGAVKDYHKQMRIRLPNVTAHALVHIVVENQLASGDPPAARTALARLMKEGLDRHESIHAIGSLVSAQMFAALKGEKPDRKAYEQQLARLTAESWRKSGPTG